MKKAKQRPVVVDTNIIFSMLLSGRSSFSEMLLSSNNQFFVCEAILIELFKHKERIVKASSLSEEELIRLYHILLKRINIYKEDLIAPTNRRKAFDLCSDVDESDAPHVALTLELDGVLWTGDKKLESALKRKGFNQFFELPKKNTRKS